MVEAAAYYGFVGVLPTFEPPVDVSLGAPDGALQLRIVGTRRRGVGDVPELQDRLDTVEGTATWNESGGRTSLTVRIPTGLAAPSR
jgi:hypothetical protein